MLGLLLPFSFMFLYFRGFAGLAVVFSHVICVSTSSLLSRHALALYRPSSYVSVPHPPPRRTHERIRTSSMSSLRTRHANATRDVLPNAIVRSSGLYEYVDAPSTTPATHARTHSTALDPLHQSTPQIRHRTTPHIRQHSTPTPHDLTPH